MLAFPSSRIFEQRVILIIERKMSWAYNICMRYCVSGHADYMVLQVEVEGWTVEGCANGSAKEVVRACVSPIPCGTRSLVVDELNDGVWGSE